MSTQSAPSAAVAPPETEGNTPTPKRRSRAKPLVIGGVIVLLLAGTILYLHTRNREGTDDAEVEGHVEAVAPRVAGLVVEVDINDNQVVQPGQVLFRLDDHTYRAALEQAEADLAAARASEEGASTGVPITAASSTGTLSAAQASLLEAQSGETLSERQLDAARAQLTAAQAQVAQDQATSQNAAATEQRYGQLVGKQEVSQLQYDQVATAAKAAAAVVDAAQARVVAAQQQIASANAEVEVARGKVAEEAAMVRSAATAPQKLAVSRAQAHTAEARVAEAEAAVATAQLNLGYTVITAPTGGEVGNKHVELGQNFAPGQTALVIVPINDVWVIANYKETQLQSMYPGQPAEVSVDAYDVTLRAKVQSLGAGTGDIFSLLPPENATGNYVKVVQRIPVKLVFDDNQDLSRLRPGMSVETTVFTGKK